MRTRLDPDAYRAATDQQRAEADDHRPARHGRKLPAMNPLRALILDLAAVNDEIDVADLTDEVLAAIPPDRWRQWLRDPVRRYVSEVLAAERRAVLAQPTADTDSIPTARSPRSRRTIAHAAWKAKLDVLVAVGDNQRKRLGQLTQLEVTAAAQRLGRQAFHLNEQAQWYARIADAMRAVDAATVAELPETTLRPLLDKVAAA